MSTSPENLGRGSFAMRREAGQQLAAKLAKYGWSAGASLYWHYRVAVWA